MSKHMRYREIAPAAGNPDNRIQIQVLAGSTWCPRCDGGRGVCLCGRRCSHPGCLGRGGWH
jgi:hypothetical protein